jgi:hypothetical protein
MKLKFFLFILGIQIFIFSQSCKVVEPPKKIVRYIGGDTGYYNWNSPKKSIVRAQYYVIIAGFPDSEEAMDFKTRMTLKGYPVVLLPPENGRIRVSAGSYAFKENAEKMRDKYARENLGIKPWILIR